MERRGVADAAADAKIGALVGADGVESTIGAHGGAARGSAAGGRSAVVAAADLELKQDLPVGDTLLPDLQLKKASDAVSDVEAKGGMQAVHQEEEKKVGQKREWEEESDDSDTSYVSSDISSSDVVLYKSASSDASSEGDVNKYNIMSFQNRVEEKLWAEGLDAYMKPDGQYYCKFHPFKQYLYWEKVQPQDDPTLTLRYSVRPLMRNWTEAAIGRRDDYDTENGRGLGVVKIENNITEEYREEIPKILVPPKRKVNSARKSTGTGKSEVTPRSTKKASSTMEMRMESMLKRMVKELQRDIIQELPDICAKVRWNILGNESPMFHRHYSHSLFALQKVVELMNKGGVMYKPPAGSVTNDDGLDEGTGSFHNGPMENKEFMEQKESDTPPAHGSPPNGHAAASNGGDFVNVDDEKLFSDEFVTPHKPNGSHFIGVPDLLDSFKDVPQDSATLSAKEISAAVLFVELAGKSEKHGKKNVYKSSVGDLLTTRWLKVILDHQWLSDDAYFPVNIDDTQWNTVVMHIPKKEFQVLDSLYPITQTTDTVKALRSQIAADIDEANSLTNGMYPDVSDWPIKSYDMPKQKRWEKVNDSRRLTVAQIVLATTNILDLVKSKVVDMSKRIPF
ncbi:hypothetical protein ACQ4PT_028780 [Festuca glaucescens]